MEKHITNAAPCNCSLIICCKKSTLFFPWIWVSVCVVENLPVGDRLIAWQRYWRTNWRPLSHLSLAWLSAILMSLFIAILSLHLASSLERFAMWLRQTSKLFLFYHFVTLGCLGLHSQCLFSHSIFFLFLFLFLTFLLSWCFLFFHNLHFKMTVTDISKQNPIAHMTSKSELFYIKTRHTHTFKDISFTAFPLHLIPTDLQVCTLISRLTR